MINEINDFLFFYRKCESDLDKSILYDCIIQVFLINHCY